MSDIKLLTKETDFSELDIRKLGWDLEFDNKPYNVYGISHYCHTIGGKYGNNDYYCCPAGEKPYYDNLMAFDGKAPIWGVEYKQKNSYRVKWGEVSVQFRGTCTITRNGKAFYSFGAREMEYGLSRAQVLLVEIQEHPIQFHNRNWREEAINREIYYCNQPAIITEISESLGGEICVKIVPDKNFINIFSKPPWMKEDHELEYYEEAYRGGVKDDILTNNIYWYRE